MNSYAPSNHVGIQNVAEHHGNSKRFHKSENEYLELFAKQLNLYEKSKLISEKARLCSNMEVVDVFPWLPPITTRVLFLEYSNKNSGYEYILIPSAFDLINSGLSFFACIPAML